MFCDTESICVRVLPETVAISLPYRGERHQEQWLQTSLENGRVKIYHYETGEVVYIEIHRDQEPVSVSMVTRKGKNGQEK